MLLKMYEQFFECTSEVSLNPNKNFLSVWINNNLMLTVRKAHNIIKTPN